MAQWVQHKSGIGEKWEVTSDRYQHDYAVKSKIDHLWHYLPRSEYVPCEPPTPPKRWVDVTEQCDFGLSNSESVPFQHFPYQLKCNTLFDWPRLATLEGYRLRKVEYVEDLGRQGSRLRHAFVVEKEQP